MTRTAVAAAEPSKVWASAAGGWPVRVGARALLVRLALGAAGGALLEAASPDVSWWWAAPLAIAGLLFALRPDSVPAGLATGATFGLAFFLPHVRWADAAVGSPVGWIALATSQAAFLAAFGGTWVWLRRARWLRHRHGRQALAAAATWIAVEQLRGRWPFGGFPWGDLAFSQTDGPLLRLASLGGSTLVGVTVVVAGALLESLTAAGRRRWTPAVALVALTGGVAAAQYLTLGVDPQVGAIDVGAVQGNVPSGQSDFRSRALQVTANHATGTRDLLGSRSRGTVDLVLWPESAADVDPRSDQEVAAIVDDAAREVGAPILLGTQRFEGQKRFNDYILWEPGVGARASYTKQHPVPFGEYIPYRSFFRRVTRTVDQVGTDMAPGRGPAVIEVPIARLGRSVPLTTVICFEVAYDDLVRQSVLAGSQAIVVPTNNASFGRTAESTQQLAMSRFRAAEHNRAVVQISTVGVSAIVAPDGSVLQRTGLFTAEPMAGQVPLRTSLTLSDRLGPWPGRMVDLATLVLACGALVGAVRRRRSGPQQAHQSHGEHQGSDHQGHHPPVPGHAGHGA